MNALQKRAASSRKVIPIKLTEERSMAESFSLPVSAPPSFTPVPAKTIRSKSFGERGLLGVVIAAIVLIPILYSPLFQESREFIKQFFLIVFGSLGLIFITIDIWSKGRFIVPRYPTIIFILVTFLAWTVSAILSRSRYLSFFGYNGTESQALTTIFFLGLFLFFLVYLRDRRMLLRSAALFSFLVLFLASAISLIGVKIFPGVKLDAWNPIGTTTVFGMVVAIGIIFAIGLLSQKDLHRGIRGAALLTLVLGIFILLGINYPLAWIILGAGSLLVAILFFGKAEGGHSLQLILPLICLAISVVYLIIPLRPFFSTPPEVGPATRETWSVVRATLSESPVLGSGLATFVNDFARFRSAAISQTVFWNILFQWGSSAALTLLGTTGILGFVLWIFTLIWVFAGGFIHLVQQRAPEGTWIVYIGAFLATAVTFLVPTPLGYLLFLVIFLGLLMGETSTQEINLKETSRGMLYLNIFTTFTILLILLSGIIFGRKIMAEVIVSKAFGAISGSPAAMEEKVFRVVGLDPWHDGYLRMLVDVERLNINDLQSKLASASPEEQGSLLAELQKKTQLGLEAARRATQLAPGSFANWNSLGNLYANIAPFTQGAPEEAIKAYGEARTLNPNDPSLLTNLAIAEKLKVEKEKEKGEGEKRIEGLLSRALELQPAYALAHLELARFYASKNDFEKAKTSYINAEILFPRDPNLAYEAGIFYLGNNKKDEARDEFLRAISLAPNFSNARWFLSQIYEDKEIDKAIGEIENILSSNPDNKLVTERLETLKKKKSGVEEEAKVKK